MQSGQGNVNFKKRQTTVAISILRDRPRIKNRRNMGVLSTRSGFVFLALVLVAVHGLLLTPTSASESEVGMFSLPCVFGVGVSHGLVQDSWGTSPRILLRWGCFLSVVLCHLKLVLWSGARTERDAPLCCVFVAGYCAQTSTVFSESGALALLQWRRLGSVSGSTLDLSNHAHHGSLSKPGNAQKKNFILKWTRRRLRSLWRSSVIVLDCPRLCRNLQEQKSWKWHTIYISKEVGNSLCEWVFRIVQ